MDILELGNDAAAIDQLLYLVEEPSDMHDVLIWPSTVTKLRHGAFLPIDIRKGQDPLHMFAFGPRTDLPLAVADEYDQITMFLAIAATDGRVLDNNTRHKCQTVCHYATAENAFDTIPVLQNCDAFLQVVFGRQRLRRRVPERMR